MVICIFLFMCSYFGCCFFILFLFFFFVKWRDMKNRYTLLSLALIRLWIDAQADRKTGEQKKQKKINKLEPTRKKWMNFLSVTNTHTRSAREKRVRKFFLCIIHDIVLTFAYIPFKNYVNEWRAKSRYAFAKRIWRDSTRCHVYDISICSLYLLIFALDAIDFFFGALKW